MSYLARGPARSAGIDSKANAWGGRHADVAALHKAFKEAAA